MATATYDNLSSSSKILVTTLDVLLQFQVAKLQNAEAHVTRKAVLNAKLTAFSSSTV